MKNIKKNLLRKIMNFLNSGYTFSEDEYELQSKYILLNSMLSISILLVSIMVSMQLVRGELKLVLFNSIQILLGLTGIYFLRKSKKIFNYVSHIIFGLFTFMLIVTIVTHPNDYMRIGWFLILIIIIFLLSGYRVGYPIALVALVTIASAYFLSTDAVTVKAYLLWGEYVVLVTILVQLYDCREKKIKNRLYQLNLSLEERISRETNKRVKLYQKSNEQLEKMAHYDILTKLPNRILFFDRLSHAVKKAQRNKTKLAVMFLDLDNFKEINDSFGHLLGDKVLKTFASRLEQVFRQSDSIARFGGDEFVLLVEDIRETSAVIQIAQGIDRIFSDSINIEEKDFFLSASIGVAVYPDDGTDSEELIKNADVAMYAAKKNGRNQIAFYTEEMTEYSKQRLMIDHQIRLGIKNNEFIVYYQPIISNEDHSLAGLEALIRWNHPERGLTAPNIFMPVAEMSSHIIDLGGIVLQQVAEQISIWHEQGFDPPYIAVNISPKQLRDDNLVPLLKRILDSVTFRRDWLQIEITEGYAIENFDEAIKKLYAIRQLGILLSLDDFGTGYSSLAYLKKLPISKLKIDRSFIRDIISDPEDRILVKAIISFSHELKLHVIAEGVENEEQFKMIKKMGCEFTQGYYFDKPMPPFDIEANYLNRR